MKDLELVTFKERLEELARQWKEKADLNGEEKDKQRNNPEMWAYKDGCEITYFNCSDELRKLLKDL